MSVEALFMSNFPSDTHGFSQSSLTSGCAGSPDEYSEQNRWPWPGQDSHSHDPDQHPADERTHRHQSADFVSPYRLIARPQHQHSASMDMLESTSPTVIQSSSAPPPSFYPQESQQWWHGASTTPMSAPSRGMSTPHVSEFDSSYDQSYTYFPPMPAGPNEYSGVPHPQFAPLPSPLNPGAPYGPSSSGSLQHGAPTSFPGASPKSIHSDVSASSPNASPSGTSFHLTEEDRFLLLLREDAGLRWKDVVAHFSERYQKQFRVPALQMRYKRLKDRMAPATSGSSSQPSEEAESSRKHGQMKNR